MYFVVYFIAIKQYTIIPKNWVRNGDEMIEKFINYSINRNQEHLCFWSSQKDENDEPRGEPNFEAEISDTILQNGEMCFKGKLKKFFSK